MSTTAAQKIDLDALDLTALMCSRVCHDVISPVGAIINGLELLDEDDDEETRAIAFDLIRKSARQASAKLQFARLAFGAAGSAGALIDLGDAEAVARGMFESEKVSLEWRGERANMPKNKIKLLLNLVLAAMATIPRGGKVAVAVEGTAEMPNFIVTTTGSHARIPPALESMLMAGEREEPVDAHAVQPYYTRQLALATDMALALGIDGDTVTLTARSAGEAPAE